MLRTVVCLFKSCWKHRPRPTVNRSWWAVRHLCCTVA